MSRTGKDINLMKKTCLEFFTNVVGTFCATDTATSYLCFTLDVVQFLLEQGSNPNHVDSENWSPLRSAAQNGHTNIIKLLLDHGESRLSVSNSIHLRKY